LRNEKEKKTNNTDFNEHIFSSDVDNGFQFVEQIPLIPLFLTKQNEKLFMKALF